MMAAVFDLGLVGYWAVPTAPPWWAGKTGRMPPVRRIMVETGEHFWGAPGVRSTIFWAETHLPQCPRFTSRHPSWLLMCSLTSGRCRASSAGAMPRRLGSRSCTSGSTTSWT